VKHDGEGSTIVFRRKRHASLLVLTLEKAVFQTNGFIVNDRRIAIGQNFVQYVLPVSVQR
jgi:hypothetical protein